MRPLLAIVAALALVATGLSTAAAPAEAVETARIAGADRYETAVEADRAVEAAGGPVFLASGVKFPDALGAAPVVTAEGGHLLLTRPDELPAVVADRIRELAPDEIVIVGSVASISDGVAAQAAGAAQAGSGVAPRVTRIGGADRVDTSLLLFERLLRSGPVEQVWVASGALFPDALVAAAVAGQHGHGVILDHHGASESSAQAWLERVASSVEGRHVAIAGGEPSVSAFDARGLEAAGAIDVERHAGSNRYETARIINAAWADETAEPTMLLATGQNFPDALAGAAVAAAVGIPLFLTPSECSDSVNAMLWQEADRRGITTVIGLGSAAAIRSSVLTLGFCPRPLRDQIGALYGTFPAQTFSGTGNQVVELSSPVAYARIRATFDGPGLTEVIGLDGSMRALAYPIWAGSSYSGESLMVARESWGVRYLQIRGRGSWTLEIRDLTGAPILTGSARGRSDAVYLYDGPPRGLGVTSGGYNEFTASGLDGAEVYGLVGRRSGAFSTVAELREGPGVISIGASNPWTLTLR